MSDSGSGSGSGESSPSMTPSHSRSHSGSSGSSENSDSSRRRRRNRRNRRGRRRVDDSRSGSYSGSDSENDNSNSSERGRKKKKDKKNNQRKAGIIPINKEIKIKAKAEGGDKFLSCHRYYPKDLKSDTSTKVMLEKRELEGQYFKLQSEFKGLYTIVFTKDDYDMENWKIALEDNGTEETLDVLNSQTEKTAFKLIKNENSETYYIQDALTDYYLNESDKLVRDDFSSYLVAEKEPKTKWQIE